MDLKICFVLFYKVKMYWWSLNFSLSIIFSQFSLKKKKTYFSPSNFKWLFLVLKKHKLSAFSPEILSDIFFLESKEKSDHLSFKTNLYLYYNVKLKLFWLFVDYLIIWHISFWAITILHIIMLFYFFFFFKLLASIFYPIVLEAPLSSSSNSWGRCSPPFSISLSRSSTSFTISLSRPSPSLSLSLFLGPLDFSNFPCFCC